MNARKKLVDFHEILRRAEPGSFHAEILLDCIHMFAREPNGFNKLRAVLKPESAISWNEETDEETHIAWFDDQKTLDFLKNCSSVMVSLFDFLSQDPVLKQDGPASTVERFVVQDLIQIFESNFLAIAGTGDESPAQRFVLATLEVLNITKDDGSPYGSEAIRKFLRSAKSIKEGTGD